MSTAEARRVAIGVFLVVSAIVAWSSLVERGSVLPPFKTVVALLVLGAGMLVGADIAPEIFGPLILLVGITVAISKLPAGGGKSEFFSRYSVEPSQPSEPPRSGGTMHPNEVPA